VEIKSTALEQGGLGLLFSSAGLFAGFICLVANLYQFRLKVCYLFIQITKSLRKQIVSPQFASHVSGLQNRSDQLGFVYCEGHAGKYSFC
jgi:hypothetical protein